MAGTGYHVRVNAPHDFTAEQVAEMVRRYSQYEPRERVDLIAADFGVTKAAVIYHARKAGVTRRGAYTKSGTCTHCSKAFTYTASHAKRAPRLYCSIPCRTAGYRGRIHGNYSTSATECTDGYRYVPVPEGHATRSRKGKRRNRVAEHVLVAEVALGRAMRAGEVVHHINGDKLDNRNANLLVCTDRYHKALHQRMSVLYQQGHFGGGNF